MRLAAKQIVAHLLLRRELRLAGKHRIVFRAKRRHLCRRFKTGNRLRDLIEGRAGAAAIDWPEMDRQRVVGRRWSRPVADLVDLARPGDREGLLSPHALEQRAIGPLRGAIDEARDIRQAHLHRVGRRPLRLLGGRIAEPAPGRPHIPEIAADKVALTAIVVQHRRERRVGVRLRLAIAEASAYRPRIGSRGTVQLRHGTGKAGLGHVAEHAGFVTVHRELFVIHDELAEQLDLLDLIVGWRGQPLHRLPLDLVDLGLEVRNLPQRLKREGCAGLLRAHPPVCRRWHPPQSILARATPSLSTPLHAAATVAWTTGYSYARSDRVEPDHNRSTMLRPMAVRSRSNLNRSGR